MQKTEGFIVPLIIIIIAAGIVGAFVYMQKSSDTYNDDGAMMEDEMMEKDGSMMEEDTTMKVPAQDTEGVGEMMEKGDSMMEDTEGSMMEGGDSMMEDENMMMEDAPKTITVTYTASGFSPSSVTIHSGDTVRFVNESGRSFWPASAFHPTHTVYPGSNINKCGTAGAATIFDACRNFASGESYSFTFMEKGKWNYHDHLNASAFGSVVVE